MATNQCTQLESRVATLGELIEAGEVNPNHWYAYKVGRLTVPQLTIGELARRARERAAFAARKEAR